MLLIMLLQEPKDKSWMSFREATRDYVLKKLFVTDDMLGAKLADRCKQWKCSPTASAAAKAAPAASPNTAPEQPAEPPTDAGVAGSRKRRRM